ncbi:MAG: DUF1566 domain-containing protein, partial [Prevotella sp.]|nr:DUF1566 domain-containing protein [Prevotella sp.]
MKNTLDIIKGDPSDNTAAGICANYSIVRNNVTYDDWFLPSKDELELIFVNLRQVNVGNWPKDELGEYFAYWTSSESGPNTAWGKCFQTLVTMGGEKYYPLSIRP